MKKRTNLWVDPFKRFPTPGVTNYTINTYDILENLVDSQDELGRTTVFAYDPMNRLVLQTLPDGSVTAFGYNAAGSQTNRTMPGGLTWSATYDSANRMTAERLAGSSLTDRQFTYQYYQAGPNIGQLQMENDLGRGVSATANYDAYLRVASYAANGSMPDQNLSLNVQYDERGLITSLTQNGVSTTTSVSRKYDAYGQTTEETISINGTVQSDFTQGWDSDHRRTLLNQTGAGTGGSINYSYQADGLLTNVFQGGQNYGFSYTNNDLLVSRQNPWRSVALSQRD